MVINLRILSVGFLLSILSISGYSQPDRWQQRVEYNMNVEMDVQNHQFTGYQELTYHNNSPDTLTKVFYHLYFNAFQPGSMMDIRSRSIEDPDRRVRDRIYKLNEDETGYQKIISLKQDGQNTAYEVSGTILEVDLAKPIPPNSQTKFTMEFEGQVPVQIRRSGRNNKEGIAYSMAQWYPKISEYDYEGWHADPYIGREFHGVFGSYDVKITIDADYTLGGTGIVQNPNDVGHGYQDEGVTVDQTTDKLTWHFKADKVHDFMWAADPDYVHDIVQVPNGPEVHFLYQDDTLVENWHNLQDFTVRAFQYMSENFGKYPYEKYSVIQGGDGGMEYPMATLITGHRSFRSLVGVTVHEMGHSWYHTVLATNESMYPWMDEGFTTYAANRTSRHLFGGNQDNPHARDYSNYFTISRYGLDEPLSIHADHFPTNRAYSTGSYSKGAIFLHQLSYILGEEPFNKGLKKYFNTWNFKHPNPTDFKRVMEKSTNIHLDWYLMYWINTTYTVDYGIKAVQAKENSTTILLEKIGKIPMPLDVMVYFKDGSKTKYYIPLRIMHNEKPKEGQDYSRITKKDWPWTYPEYELNIHAETSQIDSVVIDPSDRMADINRDNNQYPETEQYQFSD